MADGASDLVLTQLAAAAGGVTYERGRAPLTGRYPCYRVYECADGRHFSVAALEPKFWTTLCDALGRPDLVSLQYAEGVEGERAHAEMEALFRSRTRSDWEEALDGVDACAEPVLELEEMVASGWQLPPPGPALGEHTVEVLAAAGCGAQEVERLRAEAIVTAPSG